MHQNINRLLGKLLEIELFLRTYHFDILCFTETFLKTDSISFSLCPFNKISSFVRTSADGGGSLILINNELGAKERKDIVSVSVERHCEISCAELESIIIICVYSPPSACFDIFLNTLDEALRKLSNTNKRLIMCGDFNIDLLADSPQKKQFIFLCKSYSMKELFNEPTRITSSTATCLDNIFLNCEYSDKALIDCLRSDHRGQAVTLLGPSRQKENKVVCRPITQKRQELFRTAITEQLENFTFNFECPNLLFNSLFEIVSATFQSIFKKTEIKFNVKPKFADWATKGITLSRETLYGLYEKKKYTTNKTFFEYVKRYSYIFKQVCCQAKSLYIRGKILNSNNKIKTTWDIIKKETGKTEVKESVGSLRVDCKVISDRLGVANAFEKFFTDIPFLLTKDLDRSFSATESFLKDNVLISPSKFTFHYVTAQTVEKTFRTLKVKKTEDLWGLSVKVLRTIIYQISPLLAVIFNSCIDKGIFPSLMKEGKIIPLYKSGCKEDPSNYRPISILPALSKVFEKMILNQLTTYFYSNKLLHERQFGFTKGRSTLDAGTKLISFILDAWESKHDALGVFCDLSKAFDCVHHDTLLMKLEYYGIAAQALSLIASYLADRGQRVAVSDVKSSGSLIKLGVPQGSILGPFLFLIYVNDLPYVIQRQTSNEVVLFADDTSLLFKTKRGSSDLSAVNYALGLISNWFAVNNLVLNPSKTKCIKFTLPNVNQAQTHVTMGTKIDTIEYTKFLGIVLDSKLQWGPHVYALGNRLSSAVYAIREVRKLTDVATARLVYFAYFHSLMSYGILLWGAGADISVIFILQKRAIRAIYNLKSRDSLRDLFNKINILTLPSLYIYENIMYTRKNSYNFKKRSDVHGLNTRNKDKLMNSAHRLQKTNKSFVGNSVRFYNKLPTHIIDLTEKRFKNCIKQKLVKKAYYTTGDYLADTKAWDDEE